MTTKIAVITIGHNPNPIIEKLLEIQDIGHISFILSNLLDYTLPPKVRNSINQSYFHELRFILKQLGANEYVSISDTLAALLKENDRLDLSIPNLALVSHISQINQNSKNMKSTYNILIAETGRENVSLHPLVSTNPDLLLFRGKKYSPLRFFAEKGELLTDEPPETDKKRKYSDKKYTIENIDVLKSLKFNDDIGDIIDNADLTVILASDYVSLGAILLSKEIKNQIKKTNTPLVFIWDLEDEASDQEAKILDAMGLGKSLSDYAQHLSELADYVFIDRRKIDDVELLRDEGCKVIVEDFYNDNLEFSDKSINSILTIGGIDIAEDISIDEESNHELEKSDDSKENDGSSSSKSISQLLESPEESGESKKEIIEEVVDINNNIPTKNNTIPIKEVESSNTVDEVTEKEEIETGFSILEEEEWFDTTIRAIDLLYKDIDDSSFDWLLIQSKKDSEQEQQIAESVISRWIESRSITSRKKGAKIIAKLVQSHLVIYQQILQKHMIDSVTKRSDEKRRQLIFLYHMLYDVSDTFALNLIGNIVRDLASLSEGTDPIVFEVAKLTILQLVVGKKKLSNCAISEILMVIESKQGSNAELWNILTSFDASSVAIEMVTRFPTGKIEEITRRSSILRFTGSFYSIISKVILAWKDGDKVTLSNVVGSILPESTLRKFERMELARSVEKLRMVQLSTLAETLKKDIINVEKLVTELIVNGELQAEFKLIDDKMYLVAKDKR